jgi:hypothetical protein
MSLALFVLAMVVLHVALGWVAGYAFYKRRLNRMVEEVMADAITAQQERIREYGQRCHEQGRAEGANETAMRAILVGLHRN